jgi:hypothetical protein
MPAVAAPSASPAARVVRPGCPKVQRPHHHRGGRTRRTDVLQTSRVGRDGRNHEAAGGSGGDGHQYHDGGDGHRRRAMRRLRWPSRRRRWRSRLRNPPAGILTFSFFFSRSYFSGDRRSWLLLSLLETIADNVKRYTENEANELNSCFIPSMITVYIQAEGTRVIVASVRKGA